MNNVMHRHGMLPKKMVKSETMIPSLNMRLRWPINAWPLQQEHGGHQTNAAFRVPSLLRGYDSTGR